MCSSNDFPPYEIQDGQGEPVILPPLGPPDQGWTNSDVVRIVSSVEPEQIQEPACVRAEYDMSWCRTHLRDMPQDSATCVAPEPRGLPDWMFRDLDSSEERLFRRWARDNHIPGEPISPAWHPAVRDECAKIDRGEVPTV